MTVDRRQPPAPGRRAMLAALLMGPAWLAGCDMGPDYRRPDAEIPPAFRATPASAQAAWPSDDWWRGFDDPTLTILIDAARAQNFDLRAAIARVKQADARARIAGAALFPSLSGNGSADWQHAGVNTGSRARSGGGNASYELRSYGVGLNASYMLDFWGGNRATQLAAVTAAVASRFDQQTVALTVVTDTASTWFTAQALNDRLAVAQDNLAAFERTLTAIRARFAAGTASALDVTQEETLVARVRAVVPGLKSQIDQQVNALGLLTGRPPEAITARPGSLTGMALPVVSPGLPSELLLRRPDIAAAEARLIAANFDIKAARAAFFPTIQLTGAAGFQAAALNSLLGPGGLLVSAAAGLVQPLFDGGALRGQLELAKGQYDELLALYLRAIVAAFTDVDNALTAWRYTNEQEKLQEDAVATAKRAAVIAKAQMSVGTIDITTVLQIETALFESQDALVQVRLARALALVNLYKALGGGWMRPGGDITDQFPGLTPGALEGGIALPVGGNVR